MLSGKLRKGGANGQANNLGDRTCDSERFERRHLYGFGGSGHHPYYKSLYRFGMVLRCEQLSASYEERLDLKLRHYRHFVIGTALKKATRRLLILPSPLLKKESSFGAFALRAQRFDPCRIHRPGAMTAFTNQPNQTAGSIRCNTLACSPVKNGCRQTSLSADLAPLGELPPDLGYQCRRS